MMYEAHCVRCSPKPHRCAGCGGRSRRPGATCSWLCEEYALTLPGITPTFKHWLSWHVRRLFGRVGPARKGT